MRTALTASLCFALAAPLVAQDSTITIRARTSQDRLDPRALPRDVADEVIRFFNDPRTVHFSGRTRIPAERGVDGDVVVLGGPVSIAGRVSGRLIVINGDVELERGAVVGGDVLVVGGTIGGAADAEIAGEVRSYREILRYRRDGEELAYAPDRDVLPRWARRTRWSEEQRSRSGIFLALGHTYNRVEGVPIVFGPRVDAYMNDGVRFQGELFGIVRSGRSFSLDEGDVGYRLRGEFVFGSRRSNLGLGARAYDVVGTIESWPLKDYEAGWGAFLFHSDYRDYFRRRGVSAFAALRPSSNTTLQLEGREERQFSIDDRDPWTIFRSEVNWRANPAVTGGLFRSAVLSLRLDTRNDRSDPTAGFFVAGEVESGRGTDLRGAVDPRVCGVPACHPDALDGTLTYRRAFLDARTYLRLTPTGRLNLRVVGGGRLGGEALPLQRRVSVGGPDPLPGYDFRQLSCGGSGFNGLPALCDRVIVTQAEFRTHLGFDFGPDWVNDWGDADSDYEPFHVSGPDVVVFADAARAWDVGNDPSLGQIPSDRLPALSTFLADIGVGMDFGPLGFYLAKAVGRGAGTRDLTFTVRMGRRF